MQVHRLQAGGETNTASRLSQNLSGRKVAELGVDPMRNASRHSLPASLSPQNNRRPHYRLKSSKYQLIYCLSYSVVRYHMLSEIGCSGVDFENILRQNRRHVRIRLHAAPPLSIPPEPSSFDKGWSNIPNHLMSNIGPTMSSSDRKS